MPASSPIPFLPPRFVFLFTGFLTFTTVLFFALLAGSDATRALRDAMISALILAWISKGIASALNQSFVAAAREAEEQEEDAPEAAKEKTPASKTKAA